MIGHRLKFTEHLTHKTFVFGKQNHCQTWAKTLLSQSPSENARDQAVSVKHLLWIWFIFTCTECKQYAFGVRNCRILLSYEHLAQYLSPTDLEWVQMKLILQVLVLYACIYYKKGFLSRNFCRTYSTQNSNEISKLHLSSFSWNDPFKK